MGRGGVGEMSILRSNGNNWGRWAAYRIALMYSLTVHFCTVDNNLAIWQSDNPTIWQGSPWSSFVSADSITNSVNKFSDFKTCSAELKRLQQLSREKWFCQLQKVSPVWSGHSNFKNKDYHSHWCFSKVMEAPHTNLCPAQRTLYRTGGRWCSQTKPYTACTFYMHGYLLLNIYTVGPKSIKCTTGFQSSLACSLLSCLAWFTFSKPSRRTSCHSSSGRCLPILANKKNNKNTCLPPPSGSSLTHHCNPLPLLVQTSSQAASFPSHVEPCFPPWSSSCRPRTSQLCKIN